MCKLFVEDLMVIFYNYKLFIILLDSLLNKIGNIIDDEGRMK